MANRFLNNIRINDAYTFPASDGNDGQVITTDGAGNLAFENVSPDAASVIYRDNFTGDGSTVTFDLQNSITDEDQTQIYIDGVYQEKSTYSISGTTITFTTAPILGHSVEVISISSINTGPTVLYQDNFTGNGNDTAFTLGQIIDNEIKTFIFLNGVYQFKNTYTVDGTTLTFDTAPANGVAIEVVSIASAVQSDSLEAGAVIIPVKNTHTASISKGTPVYITGNVGASERLQIAPADASNSAKMPAAGLLLTTLAVNAEGYVITGGYLRNLTTDTIDGTSTSSNDTVYVKAGGGLTMTKPTGSNLIQNIAKVARSASGNSGSLLVSSILRTNDIPNLTTGKIWVGSANNTIESGTLHLDESNNRLGINNNNPSYSLDVTGDANISSNVIVGGNLTVQGTETILNTQTVEVEDNILQLNTTQGSPDTATATTSGISIYRGSGVAQASFIFDDADNTWDLTNNLALSGKILVGTGATAAASLNAYTQTVSANLYSALRIIENSGASSYWDIGATGGGSPNLNFYVNAGTTPKLTISSSGNATFAGNVGVGGKIPTYGLNLAQGTGTSSKIAWTDGTPDFAASIYANSSTDKLTFATKNASNVETIALEIDISQNATFAGNVGIGTTSPGTFYPGNHNLVVGDGNADSAITVYANPANTSYLLFADGTSGSSSYTAQVRYNHSTNHMEFATNNSTTAKMTLDDNGNLGIAETSPNGKLDIKQDMTAGTTAAFTSPHLRLSANNTVDNTGFVGMTFATSTANNYGFSWGALRTTSALGGMHLRYHGNSASGTDIFNIDYVGNVTIATQKYIRSDSSGGWLTIQGGATYPGGRIDMYGGSNAAAGIEFLTGGTTSTPTLRFRIDDNGDAYFTEKLGIGTTSPDGPLHISFSDSNTGYANASAVFITNTNSTTNNRAHIFFTDSVGGPGAVAISTQFVDHTNNYGDLLFSTRGSGGLDERMRINSVGDIIIKDYGNIYASTNNSTVNSGIYFGGTDNTLRFYTNNDEKMRITSGGKVGIGTENSQNAELAIKSGSNFDLELYSESGGTAWQSYNRTTSTWGYLRFIAGGGEQMRIHTNGSVGIGVTSPNYKLHVGGDLSADSSFSSYTADGLYSSNARPSIIETPGWDMKMKFGYSDNGGGGYAPRIGFQQTYHATNAPNTTTIKSSIGLESSGNFEIKTGASNGVSGLVISSTGRIIMPNLDGKTQVHPDVSYRTSDGELFYQTSSERYKTDIVNLESCLNKIDSLRPVRFTDINTNEPGFGLIAEETNEIIPEVVFSKDDQIEGISYSNLTPFLIKAIQELKAEIETLKNQINGIN